MMQRRIAVAAAAASTAIVVALVATPAPQPTPAGATTIPTDSSTTDAPAADRPALIAAVRQLMVVAGVQPEELLAAPDVTAGEPRVAPTTRGGQRSRHVPPEATRTTPPEATRGTTARSTRATATPTRGRSTGSRTSTSDLPAPGETGQAGPPADRTELVATFRQLLTQLGLRPEELLTQPGCDTTTTAAKTTADGTTAAETTASEATAAGTTASGSSTAASTATGPPSVDARPSPSGPAGCPPGSAPTATGK